MTDQERITKLEQRIAFLEGRVAQLEQNQRWNQTMQFLPNSPTVPAWPQPPFEITCSNEINKNVALQSCVQTPAVWQFSIADNISLNKSV